MVSWQIMIEAEGSLGCRDIGARDVPVQFDRRGDGGHRTGKVTDQL